MRKHRGLAVAADGRRDGLQRKVRGAAALVGTCAAMTRKTHRKINDAMTGIVAKPRETVKVATKNPAEAGFYCLLPFFLFFYARIYHRRGRDQIIFFLEAHDSHALRGTAQDGDRG